MPNKQCFFEDGTSLSWVDRETLKYEAGARHLLVWVDYEAGFFNRGRVIRVESLRLWTDSSGHQGSELSPSEKTEIVAKVKAYFAGAKVRVQEELSDE
jgi:hypothetical protein